jgi:hypothetical protein
MAMGSTAAQTNLAGPLLLALPNLANSFAIGPVYLEGEWEERQRRQRAIVAIAAVVVVLMIVRVTVPTSQP